MTPGFAKTRAELPWLYYPENDSVIINAHNFGGGAFSPAVNGKMPVAAWIPSRDDAGNGTTTLTDLVGSNNGTLTNMDAATDWVADTDSGGVRALDFDGVDDVVLAASTTVGNFGLSDASISVWSKLPNASNFGTLVSKRENGLPFAQWAVLQGSASAGGAAVPGKHVSVFWYAGGEFSTTTAQSFRTTGDIADGTWHHFCVVRQNGQAPKIYVDGVAVGVTAIINGIANVDADNAETIRMAAGSDTGTVSRLAQTQDDIRIWDQALTATDIAALATGRGVNVA